MDETDDSKESVSDNILIYLSIQIYSTENGIFKYEYWNFQKTNIFRYSNYCCTIFYHLIIRILIQMKPFPLIEALFDTAMGRL